MCMAASMWHNVVMEAVWWRAWDRVAPHALAAPHYWNFLKVRRSNRLGFNSLFRTIFCTFLEFLTIFFLAVAIHRATIQADLSGLEAKPDPWRNGSASDSSSWNFLKVRRSNRLGFNPLLPDQFFLVVPRAGAPRWRGSEDEGFNSRSDRLFFLAYAYASLTGKSMYIVLSLLSVLLYLFLAVLPREASTGSTIFARETELATHRTHEPRGCPTILYSRCHVPV
ncbi:hypothetical protein LMH87_002564 [Akanthomyces muscarius]|uniref:Uncharacterized protein n=1 Tax=Akanthomyces muscarius TaxID=2231603 RepID=A0A9W8Q927_AKAMU|nr:hypothetical protein LMH87_002564 [Akanthomyces muscarius]KAJ4148076.1 hypothetical protein LMH87_002564 [Akanthomyces muscarius]